MSWLRCSWSNRDQYHSFSRSVIACLLKHAILVHELSHLIFFFPQKSFFLVDLRHVLYTNETQDGLVREISCFFVIAGLLSITNFPPKHDQLRRQNIEDSFNLQADASIVPRSQIIIQSRLNLSANAKKVFSIWIIVFSKFSWNVIAAMRVKWEHANVLNYVCITL